MHRFGSHVIALVAGAVVISGCVSSTGGAYDHECGAGKLVQMSLIDLSSSGRDEALLSERLDAIQLDAERVIDCEGRLMVVGWSSSSAASRELFNRPLSTTGATEIGRDRKISKAIEGIMSDIRESVDASFGVIDPNGSDLSGAFALVADRRASLGDDQVLEVHIYTDAISTTGATAINDPLLTKEVVQDMVASQQSPNLAGARISLFGVGKVGGTVQPPQDYIAVIRAYAEAMCKATGASCRTFTSIVVG